MLYRQIIECQGFMKCSPIRQHKRNTPIRRGGVMLQYRHQVAKNSLSTDVVPNRLHTIPYGSRSPITGTLLVPIAV